MMDSVMHLVLALLSLSLSPCAYMSIDVILLSLQLLLDGDHGVHWGIEACLLYNFLLDKYTKEPSLVLHILVGDVIEF